MSTKIKSQKIEKVYIDTDGEVSDSGENQSNNLTQEQKPEFGGVTKPRVKKAKVVVAPVESDETSDVVDAPQKPVKKPRKAKAEATIAPEDDNDSPPSKPVKTKATKAKASKVSKSDLVEEDVIPDDEVEEKVEKTKAKAPRKKKVVAPPPVQNDDENDDETPVEEVPIEKKKRHVMSPLERVDTIIATLQDLGYNQDVSTQLTRLRNQLDGAKIKSTTNKRAPNAFNLWMKDAMKEFVDSDMKPKEKFAHCISLWNEKKAAGAGASVSDQVPKRIIDDEENLDEDS